MYIYKPVLVGTQFSITRNYRIVRHYCNRFFLSAIYFYRITLCKIVGFPSGKNDTCDPHPGVHWNTDN